MSALTFMAGAITATAIIMQHADKGVPWWILLIPAALLVGIAATAPGVVR